MYIFIFTPYMYYVLKTACIPMSMRQNIPSETLKERGKIKKDLFHIPLHGPWL